MTQDDLDAYDLQAARLLQRQIDYELMKELMLRIGSVVVAARPGVSPTDVEKWCAIVNIPVPINNDDEYIFARHEDATAFVLRFG
jgi:hypothetical protein